MFEEFPLIGMDTFNCITFDVIEDATSKDNKYQLVMNMVNCDFSNPGSISATEGITFETACFAKSLTEVAFQVDSFINGPLFNHLAFISGGHCLDLNGEEMYTFDWVDYIAGPSVALH